MAEHIHEHPHSHDGEHTHTHPHSHDGEHTYTQIPQDRDMEVLGLLLDHWVVHNQDHAKEYMKWIEKLESDGKPETAGCIRKAVDLMSQADQHLAEAKKTLESSKTD